jgi:hypothetical protein
MSDTLRNADLSQLAELLRDQHSRKHDMVVPAKALSSAAGLLQVEGATAVLDDEGVTPETALYRPTEVFDDGVSDKLAIPRAYLRRLREQRLDLYDANVNGWLAQDPARSFLVRTFESDSHTGIARALLSDRYRVVDHLDVLTAVLGGIRDAGVETEVRSVDLTERRMHVKVYSPAVAAYAADLLRGYRSPWTGAEADENPTVFAGFVITNSETGGGAATITPELVVQICTNGMTIRRDALRNVHLGGQLDHGVIRYSSETMQANLELITSTARDAVSTFLDGDYVRAKIAELSENAAEPVSVKAIETVTRTLAFSVEQTENVLDAFVKGGQLTRGGVTHAITAAAQLEPDADKAADMQAAGTELLLAA